MKSKCKKIAVAGIMALTLLGSTGMEAAAYVSPSITASGSAASASVMRADQIGWVFKKVNGKTYRRLYNYTTGEYLTDWELVG